MKLTTFVLAAALAVGCAFASEPIHTAVPGTHAAVPAPTVSFTYTYISTQNSARFKQELGNAVHGEAGFQGVEVFASSTDPSVTAFTVSASYTDAFGAPQVKTIVFQRYQGANDFSTGCFIPFESSSLQTVTVASMKTVPGDSLSKAVQ